MNLINDLKKLPDESYYHYIWRCDNLIKQGKYSNWEEITPIVNKELYTDEVDYKGESAYRKECKYARNFYEAGIFDSYTEDKYLKELEIQKRELAKERVKLQTEKLEYSKWLRADSRDELIIEKIVDAIENMHPLDIPEKRGVSLRKKQGALLFGDEHFGTEYELYGLFDEIINAYSPEIFESRMWELHDKCVGIINKEQLDIVHTYSMGDFTDGLLRVSQLMKLRYGVVEGTVIYADFICNWLNELSKHAYIKFQMVDGNHSQLRMLGQPKGTFENENMGLVVRTMIRSRLVDNPNFTFIENKTGMIFDKIFDYTFLGIHGEVKNMEKAIKDFSHTYNEKINYFIAGHLHHSRSETVGIDCEVINVPSIIGVDSYSLSLNKTSNAGATFLIIEEGLGKTIEYSIKLK